MSRGYGVSFVVVLLLLACARPALAQLGVSNVTVSVAFPDGSTASTTLVEIAALEQSGVTRTLVIDDSLDARGTTIPGGTYRVRADVAGFRPAETTLDATAGAILHLVVYPAPLSEALESSIVVTERSSVAHQMFFDARELTFLPGNRSAWSLLEIAHPYLIVDRIDNGGLWSAEPGLVAAYGSARAQTTFQLGGLDVTDPHVPGTPLLFPNLDLFQAVEVDSALRPADSPGPGPVITLVPRRGGDRWTGFGEFATTPRSLQTQVSEGAPSIARFDSFADGSVVAGGPVSARFSLLASARGTRARRIERDEPLVLTSDVRSVYAHLSGTRAVGDQVSLTASVTDAIRPHLGRERFADRDVEERARGLVLDSTWDRASEPGLWSLGGGFQRFVTDPDIEPGAAGGVLERLRDGPPLALAETTYAARNRWDLRVFFAPNVQRWPGGDHFVRLGATLGGARVVTQAGAQPRFGETLNGVPARVWDVQYAGAESQRTTLGASAFIQDRISLTRGLTINAGLRLDHDRGSANGTSNTIRWTDLSPRVSAQWSPAQDDRFVVTTGYSWYQHRPLMSYFAVGDPAGATGVMYRWDDLDGNRQYTDAELTVVAAIGTGGANGQAGTIDPDLRRPTTREFLIGVDYAFGSWRLRITGIDRRERNPVALVNAGVTVNDYAVVLVRDPGVDVAGLSGFDLLPIYDRLPASFGRDRYVLANPDAPQGTYQSGELSIDRPFTDRWQVRFGGLVHWSKGIGSSRGFRATENDQSLLGETFTTPNARGFARGRLFFDRAYIIKTSVLYQAPGDVNMALAARYQDGQPFARVVITDGLNQGPDFVQAYPRGAQRFTFTLTVDARVQKSFRVGRGSLGMMIEAFNLFNTSNEVEEDVVTGPRFRTETAVQPPRALRFGLRVAF